MGSAEAAKRQTVGGPPRPSRAMRIGSTIKSGILFCKVENTNITLPGEGRESHERGGENCLTTLPCNECARAPSADG